MKWQNRNLFLFSILILITLYNLIQNEQTKIVRRVPEVKLRQILHDLNDIYYIYILK